MACRHCRAEAIPFRDRRELTTQEGFDLLDAVVACGEPILISTGGDPLMRTDVYDIVAYGARRGLQMAVFPSGTARLTRAALERLHEAGARRISLSIDGPDAATHDAFHGSKVRSSGRSRPRIMRARPAWNCRSTPRSGVTISAKFAPLPN